MLGLKNSVRKMPVSTRMANEYSASSPSRNDQWSGKARFIALRPAPAAPSLSSIARASAPRPLPALRSSRDRFPSRPGGPGSLMAPRSAHEAARCMFASPGHLRGSQVLADAGLGGDLADLGGQIQGECLPAAA